MKPQTTQFTLRDCEDIDADDQPTARQIRNIIDKYNKKTFGKDKITMRQLTEFVDKHMREPQPDEIDRAFILSFERSPTNEPKKYFRFFITTRRLLEMAAKAKNIHADATYKVTREKLPLIAQREIYV